MRRISVVVALCLATACAAERTSVGGTARTFDPERDILSLHYDHADDKDDGQSAAADRTLLQSLFGTDWISGHVIPVSGAYGRNAELFRPESDAVMDAAWSDCGGWLAAHAAREAAVAELAARWGRTLATGGDVWVKEGGQSDITAAVVKRINDRSPGLETAARIHVVQHSDWNEDQTSDSGLAYTKGHTHYIRIRDANAYLNIAGGDDRFVEAATAHPVYSAIWQAAFAYYDPRERLDVSDTGELMHILGLGELDFEEFRQRFLGRPLALEGEIRYAGPESGPVVLQAYSLPVTDRGSVWRLTKADVLGGRQPARTVSLPGAGSYRLPDLERGHYSLVAFIDLDGDGALDFDPPEPLGWYAAEAAGWIDPIDLSGASDRRADIVLRQPRRFPGEERRVAHGALRWLKGMPVLQLQGTAEERGFAHGFLVGEQIIDFFEFYVLEDSWRSARRYEEEFAPFLESHFDYSPEYSAEIDAVVRGMEASGIDMRVRWLGRDFRRVDLLAINAYIERRATRPSPPAGSGCSQFAFWGDATEGSDVGGGLIAGRNMDGEVDLRKVTVSHFLLFAVDPSEPGRRRWVSTMWPGFVGTISGINEDGLYSMENAGGTGPGPVVDGLTPCAWVQRYILENAANESTPESVGEMIDRFRSAGGGAFGAGSVILWAVPYEGQPGPAFVSEGDRFGTAIRVPTDVAPACPYDIMATNHYLVYGVDPQRPGLYFGKQPSFSSRWRYETGMHTLEAWSRQRKPLGTPEMRRLLQSVAHGTTEYSVIFRANEMSVDVAVDDLAADLWDAPYQRWITYEFEEFFAGVN